MHESGGNIIGFDALHFPCWITKWGSQDKTAQAGFRSEQNRNHCLVVQVFK